MEIYGRAPLPSCRVSWRGALRKRHPHPRQQIKLRSLSHQTASLHHYHCSPVWPCFSSEGSTWGALHPLKQGPAQSWVKTGTAQGAGGVEGETRAVARPAAVGDSAQRPMEIALCRGGKVQRWPRGHVSCRVTHAAPTPQECMRCAPPDQGTLLQMRLDPLVASAWSQQPVFHLFLCFPLFYSQNGSSGCAKD